MLVPVSPSISTPSTSSLHSAIAVATADLGSVLIVNAVRSAALVTAVDAPETLATSTYMPSPSSPPSMLPTSSSSRHSRRLNRRLQAVRPHRHRPRPPPLTTLVDIVFLVLVPIPRAISTRRCAPLLSPPPPTLPAPSPPSSSSSSSPYRLRRAFHRPRRHLQRSQHPRHPFGILVLPHHRRQRLQRPSPP
ncbi:hypothetical protein EIP86_009062 [Pleurotus ostreatoroseus]|nr:hypothetical protein EIP86_009062 [Pleurotus ostreatoroseus]